MSTTETFIERHNPVINKQLNDKITQTETFLGKNPPIINKIIDDKEECSVLNCHEKSYFSFAGGGVACCPKHAKNLKKNQYKETYVQFTLSDQLKSYVLKRLFDSHILEEDHLPSKEDTINEMCNRFAELFLTTVSLHNPCTPYNNELLQKAINDKKYMDFIYSIFWSNLNQYSLEKESHLRLQNKENKIKEWLHKIDKETITLH